MVLLVRLQIGAKDLLVQMHNFYKICIIYPVNTLLKLTNNFSASFPWTFTHKKSVKLKPKKIIMTEHLMFGTTNLRQPRNFTQQLVVMVETFRRSAWEVTVWECEIVKGVQEQGGRQILGIFLISHRTSPAYLPIIHSRLVPDPK